MIGSHSDDMELAFIVIIAFVISFVGGLLGLGGAVLLIPAYLYLPGLVGLTPFDVKSVSGITSVQVFAASLLGMVLHRKKGAVDTRLVLTMGIPITITSLSGAIFSGVIHPNVIIAVFASMAILAAVLILMKRKEEEQIPGQLLSFSRVGAIGIAGGVGFFGGMVGAPGAFLLSPLMITVLRIPIRVTIGSTLGIVVLSALAASVGKIATGQVPTYATMVAIAGSLPGVYLGSIFSHRLRTKTLRRALAVLISGIGLLMWYRVLF